jgi:hypothetical protein
MKSVNSSRSVLVLLLGMSFVMVNMSVPLLGDRCQGSAKEPCPAEAHIKAQLSQRRENLLKMKSGPDHLISERANMDASSVALFTVDLKDKATVKRRTGELKNATEASAMDITITVALFLSRLVLDVDKSVQSFLLAAALQVALVFFSCVHPWY